MLAEKDAQIAMPKANSMVWPTKKGLNYRDLAASESSSLSRPDSVWSVKMSFLHASWSILNA
jgi:hypothetical protein